MAFHAVRFPIDVALGASGGSQRMTDIVTLASGAEERNSRWARSRHKYNAGYGIKSWVEMQTVLAFFEERRGRFHSFLWRDGLDHSSAITGVDPTPIDQPLGTGDGVQTGFQLTKRYGSAFDPYDREISKPDATSVRVALNNVEVSAADYTIDVLTGAVEFDAAPSAAVVLTAGFEFDVPVRFDIDFLNVEYTSFDAAHVPMIPIIEVAE